MDQTEISDRPIKASLLMARMLAIDSTCSQRRRVVEVLIEYHPDLKFVDNAGNALLILAISSNCMQLVDELLVAGLNPNVGNVQSGVTPLAFSCEYGHYDAIPVLLKHGAKTDVADSLGRFPVHDCSFMCPEFVKTIVYTDSKAINVPDTYGILPLAYVIMSNRPNAVRIEAIDALLERGADPSLEMFVSEIPDSTVGFRTYVQSSPESGESPAEFAARIGNIEIARILQR